MSVRPPARRGVHPVAALVVVALVPALVLFALWRWAAGRADGAEPAPASTTSPPAPSPTLATPLLSWRRAPAVLAQDAARAALRSSLETFAGTLNDSSCVSVSIDGVPVVGKAVDQPLIPASSHKVVIAAVALEVLGADHRFTTDVRADVDARGVVDDLYLVGGGDPLLVSDAYPNENDRFPVINATSLDRLVDAVADAGIRRIDGDVVGDASRYDDEWYVPSWADDVRAIEAGPYDALLVNDARVTGDPQRASDPALGAARELIQLLDDRGIAVRGSAATGTAPDRADIVASVQSRPLVDVIAEMLTTSDNNTSEMLVKELGVVAGDGGTHEAGLEVMSNTLEAHGVLSDGVVLADGSGLSSDNRVTCALLLAVLAGSPVDAPLGSGLPIAGESGTMADVFTDSPVSGRMRAKTGTLGNPPFDAPPLAAKALAGYVSTGDGQTIQFVLLLNGTGPLTDQSRYRPIWDALVEAIGSYPAGPRTADLAPR